MDEFIERTVSMIEPETDVNKIDRLENDIIHYRDFVDELENEIMRQKKIISDLEVKNKALEGIMAEIVIGKDALSLIERVKIKIVKE
jgi:hypothetical protein